MYLNDSFEFLAMKHLFMRREEVWKLKWFILVYDFLLIWIEIWGVKGGIIFQRFTHGKIMIF